MTLLTAEQAANRLNRTERTVRRWIKDGRLTATHPHYGRKDKWLIEESAVDQLAQELAQEQAEQQQPIAASELDQQAAAAIAARLATLEKQFSDYQAQAEKRIAALEARLNTETLAQAAVVDNTRTSARRSSATTATIEPTIATLETLPPGSILHYQFAQRHGVKPRTMLDQFAKGYIGNIERDKQNRPGEHTHWLSPEDQQQAILWWTDNKTPGYHPCEIPSCPCQQFTSEDSSEDQDTGENEQATT